MTEADCFSYKIATFIILSALTKGLHILNVYFVQSYCLPAVVSLLFGFPNAHKSQLVLYASTKIKQNN